MRYAATLMALFGVACGEADRVDTDTSDGVVVENDAARRAVLASIGQEVILPLYRDFATRAEALATAAHALATAEAAADAAATTELEAAREAWSAAIDTWQEAELFQLGPAAAMGASPGGDDLRDRIYSWPIVNPCRVDQETAAGVADAAALVSEPVNVRGLAALEVLLFDPDRDNACPPQSAINADGTWAALSDEDIRRRRATYAAAAADDLVASSTALVDAWEPAAGDFVGELGEAGLRTVYPSAQAALNALSDALFYLEKEVKDMKVAMPLGLRECAEDVCPNLVESRIAGRSTTHLANNLRGFERGWFGGEPGGEELGFDDLLVAVGASDVAALFAERLVTARAALAALPASLADALVTDKAKVEAAYDALKAVTDVLRTDVITILDLELPKRVEGDND